MKLRKIPKKSLTKTASLVFNAIFHMLCLSGLIWQVTQISINFFKFDVNKDINIKLPEETFDGKNYALYSCFNNAEMLESGAYERYLRPLFDKRRQQMVIDLGPRNETSKILIRLSWYHIHRLSRPYSDKCLNYSNVYNVSNRLGAIIDCKNDVHLTAGKVFRERIVLLFGSNI